MLVDTWEVETDKPLASKKRGKKLGVLIPVNILVIGRCIRDFYITQVNPVILQLPPLGWRYSGREHTVTILRESNEGAVKWCPPPKGPCLPADHWAWCTGLKVCVHVGPLKEVRRPDGTDFLRWRISEMKSSANPAPCAPGSHGPPAYCDSLHSASFSRTLQLTLGQPISFLLLPSALTDCLCCLNP